MQTVAIVATESTVFSVLSGAMDILSSAGSLWGQLHNENSGAPLFKPFIVSNRRSRHITANGMQFKADYSFGDCPVPQIVFIPPIWMTPSDRSYLNNEPTQNWLRHCAEEGALITSACTGSLLLAGSGLLDGKTATTHWAFMATMRENHPDIEIKESHPLVESSKKPPIITAGGHASWQKLILHLIRLYADEPVAIRAARLFLLDTKAEPQSVYASALQTRTHNDAVIQRAEQWLVKHHSKPNPVEASCEQSGLPTRTFSRRFKQQTGLAPIKYVQGLRIEFSKELLLETSKLVEDIAVQVGYEDVSFFRRLFKKATGITPANYRRKFRMVEPVSGKG